ncbi:MAG: hypothetical protein ABI769_15615 [Pseudomonadota bacterium]
MNPPAFFEQIGRTGFYRPAATVTFEQALQMCAEAMRYARSIGLTELLLNASGLVGFPSPGVFERYNIAEKWAQASAGTLRVALVVRSEHMDPEKLALLMAQNRGVSGDVFTTEAAALTWLNSHTGPFAISP